MTPLVLGVQDKGPLAAENAEASAPAEEMPRPTIEGAVRGVRHAPPLPAGAAQLRAVRQEADPVSST